MLSHSPFQVGELPLSELDDGVVGFAMSFDIGILLLYIEAHCMKSWIDLLMCHAHHGRDTYFNINVSCYWNLN